MTKIMYKQLIFVVITVYIGILSFNVAYRSRINTVYINMLAEQAENDNPEYFLNWFDYYEETPIYEVTNGNNFSLGFYNAITEKRIEEEIQTVKIVQLLLYDISSTVLENAKLYGEDNNTDNKIIFEYTCGAETNKVDLILDYYDELPLIMFSLDQYELDECSNVLSNMKISHSNGSIIEELVGEIDTSKSMESVISDGVVGFTQDEKHDALTTSAGYNPSTRILLTITLPYVLIFMVGGYYLLFIRSKRKKRA